MSKFTEKEVVGLSGVGLGLDELVPRVIVEEGCEPALIQPHGLNESVEVVDAENVDGTIRCELVRTYREQLVCLSSKQVPISDDDFVHG